MNNEQIKKMLQELSALLCEAYGDRLKSVILYGSVAKGTQTDESDIDIMILIDGDSDVLRTYLDKLADISTDMALKYCKVFSIIDVSYQEYEDWEEISPFYRNVSKEGIVLYAA